MSRASRWPVFGAILAALAVAAAACGGEGATVQGVKLIQKGRLTSCTHLPHPPFQLERGGEVVGFDVDMIDLVAKRLGVTQHVVEVPFETMRNGEALGAHRCDIVMGAMAIEPDRLESMDASKPYFDATQALVTRKGSGIRSLDDVKAQRLRLGSQTSTSGEKYVQEKGFDPRSFDAPQAQLDGLRARQVDVIVLDYAVARGLLKNPANSALQIVATVRTGERYGFWGRKNHSRALLSLVDQVIDQARTDGTYKRLHEKWIGPMPHTSPSPAAQALPPPL